MIDERARVRTAAVIPSFAAVFLDPRSIFHSGGGASSAKRTMTFYAPFRVCPRAELAQTFFKPPPMLCSDIGI